MIRQSRPILLITSDVAQEVLENLGTGVPRIDLRTDAALWSDHGRANPETGACGLASSQVAYVIYTSGSTGEPKGVAIEHRSATNLICWAHSVRAVEELEHTLFSTSLNFDLAVYECFVPLTMGGSVTLVRDILDSAQLSAPVSLINTVPSAMTALLQMGAVPETVSCINIAGEPLNKSVVESIFATTRARVVCNLYGPSEATTYSTWLEMSAESGFVDSIGRPVFNTRIYVLDAQGEPVPVGVVGEIHIAGAGLARGYLHRPGLTAERFVPDPFGAAPGGRLYRTGDLGRWRASGELEFLGRNDRQIKLRGLRIELGEIEAALLRCAGIREALVLMREDERGEKQLVAYLSACAGSTPPEVAQLRNQLGGALPEYMVPAAYVFLQRLPLTPNGKVDRKALPAPQEGAYAVRMYEPPQGKTESVLAGIWQELLPVERVGRHDDFFELGGHSLLATRVVSRIRESFQIEAPLRMFFEAASIAEQAEYLMAMSGWAGSRKWDLHAAEGCVEEEFF